MIELVRLQDLDALGVLSRVTNEMTMGEMRQLIAHDGLNFDEAAYDLLIRSKTASLLSGACEVGALRAPADQRAALRTFGEQLGMAFQITDDLLDYVGDEAETGKPVGGDLREHKVTLPLIAALPRFSTADRKVVQGLMTDPAPSDDRIAAVVQAVSTHGGLEYARERAQQHAESADRALDVLPASVARDALRASIPYVLERRR